jgi:hypothetical protein
MQRRELLRLAAAVGGGAAATGVGVAVASEPAEGQTGLTLDVSGDDATIASDGSVSAVTLDIDVEWAYDLPESTAPETVVVEVAAGPSDGDLATAASAESAQLFTTADGSESFEAGLIQQGALEAAALAPDSSGTRDTEVTVEARLRVESSGDTVLATERTSDTALLTVTREGVSASEYGEVGGDGSLTIGTE